MRDRIPIILAALGPKNVALAAELAEGWEPIFFHPEKAADVWGASLADGRSRRDPALGKLDIVVATPMAIGDDVDHLIDLYRPTLALYIGGMGARGRNFYNDLACRYGYEREAALIQDLYLDGRKKEAAAVVPAELLRAISLIGSEGHLRDRLDSLVAAGVTTLNVTPLAATHVERVASVELLRKLLP